MNRAIGRAATLAIGTLLAACGGPDKGAATPATAAGQPAQNAAGKPPSKELSGAWAIAEPRGFMYMDVHGFVKAPVMDMFLPIAIGMAGGALPPTLSRCIRDLLDNTE